MLISVFENKTNPVRFSSKLDTTITLPKNAKVRLHKAFIPRNHIIRIDGTNNSIGVNFHNKRTSDSLVVGLVQGLYGVQQLVDHINTRMVASITAKGTGQFSDFNVIFDYDKTEGVGEGCLNLELRGNSPHANFWAVLNWSRAEGNDDWDDGFEKDDGAGTGAYTITRTNDTMRCSSFTDGGGQVSSWNNSWGLNKTLTRNWWEKESTFDPALNRIRPQISDNWAGFKFTLNDGFSENAKDHSFWFGITEDVSAIDMTACGTNDLSTMTSAKGLKACVVFYGASANGKTKGTLEIFEDLNGTFTSVKILLPDHKHSPKKTDEFCLCVPQNASSIPFKPIKYQVRKITGTGDGSWNDITGGTNPNRPKIGQSTNLYMCGGFFASSGTDVPIINMNFGGDPNMSFETGALNAGSGFFSHYGRSAQIYFEGARNGNHDITEELGYEENLEKNQTDATKILAEDILNENPLVHYDGSAAQPYLNLNITNLPIDSIACADVQSATYGGGEVHHSISRTIAALSRYDIDGSGQFTNVTIESDSQNEATIELKNGSEITLNSLDFELRNGDGSVPTDLSSPLGLVLEIK